MAKITAGKKKVEKLKKPCPKKGGVVDKRAARLPNPRPRAKKYCAAPAGGCQIPGKPRIDHLGHQNRKKEENKSKVRQRKLILEGRNQGSGLRGKAHRGHRIEESVNVSSIIEFGVEIDYDRMGDDEVARVEGYKDANDMIDRLNRSPFVDEVIGDSAFGED